MTDMVKSTREWDGATGLIDRGMVSGRLPIIGPHYYIAGPPAMVTAMQQMLEDAGVSAGDVHAEEFVPDHADALQPAVAQHRRGVCALQLAVGVPRNRHHTNGGWPVRCAADAVLGEVGRRHLHAGGRWHHL